MAPSSPPPAWPVQSPLGLPLGLLCLCQVAVRCSGTVVPVAPVQSSLDVDRRHDWCWLDTDKVSEVQALSGRNVSVALMHDPANVLVRVDGSGRVTGGYLIEVLDKVALSAGFAWHPYLVSGHNTPGTRHESFTDWALEVVSKHDILLANIIITAERRRKGLTFGFPLLDTSIILVGPVKEEKPSFLSMLFSFVEPFSYWTWFAVTIAFFFQAYVYTWLEWSGDLKEHTRTFHTAFGESFVLMVGTFNGRQGNMDPKTRQGKLVMLMWTFTVTMLVASYTANLASLLVVKTTRVSSAKDMRDAVNQRLPICVPQGSAVAFLARNKYPSAVLVDVDREEFDTLPVPTLLESHKCFGILAELQPWDIASRLPSENPDCMLDAIGRPLTQVSASLAGLSDLVRFADDQSRCTNKLVVVLSAILQDMYINEDLSRLWQQNLDQASEQVCGGLEDGTSEARSILRLEATSGLLLVGALVSLLAMLWRAYSGKLSGMCEGGHQPFVDEELTDTYSDSFTKDSRSDSFAIDSYSDIFRKA